MRVRLRPAWPPAELAALYKVPHDHTLWPDHIQRVQDTVDVAIGAFSSEPPRVIADLSCGDAVIPKILAEAWGSPVLHLGDIAPGYEYQGPIEETLEKLPSSVHLFVCCETLEHLDDPERVLARIRLLADGLLLSTPFAETTDVNPEHYWGWDDNGVRDMLLAAGWAPVDYRLVDHPLARYQIWACV